MVDPLSEMSEREIHIGGHQLKFFDTTVAWKSFKRIYRNEFSNDEEDSDDDDSRETNQKKAMKNLQDLLENDEQCDDSAESTSKKLPYFAEYDYVYYNENRDSTCEYCRRNTEDLLSADDNQHSCRICERTFHESCLVSRGFCSEGLSFETMSESSGVVGWSCPNCEGLFKLLSDNEQNQIVNLFTDVSGKIINICVAVMFVGSVV